MKQKITFTAQVQCGDCEGYTDITNDLTKTQVSKLKHEEMIECSHCQGEIQATY